MNAPDELPVPPSPPAPPALAEESRYLHRVCLLCNNMFRVPADKFDAKECPNCHKG